MQRGGKRRNAGRPAHPKSQKIIQWWIYLKRADVENFEAAGGTRQQVIDWVRAYPTTKSNTDHPLIPSPITSRLLNYLESLGTSEAKKFANEIHNFLVECETAAEKVN
jgi:hypothetical protein